jgi:hypothetical protein
MRIALRHGVQQLRDFVHEHWAKPRWLRPSGFKVGSR